MIAQSFLAGAEHAGEWLKNRVYRDETLKQLDGMLQDAVVRRRLMTEAQLQTGGALRALFAESLGGALSASSIKWDDGVDARISAQQRVTEHAEREVYALAKRFSSATQGTQQYQKARAAFALAEHREIPEVCCHKAVLGALQQLRTSGRAVRLSSLNAILKARLAVAVDILAGEPLCGEAC